MSLWASALALYDTASEATAAVHAARDALSRGLGPVAALDSFAHATSGTLDDTSAREVREALVYLLTASDTVLTGALWCLDAVPTVKAWLDAVEQQVGDAAYTCTQWRSTVRGWLTE